MKKIYAIFILCFALFSFGVKAQVNTTCNPDFTFQFLSGSVIKFTPVIATDSPLVQHYWSLGDGTASNYISPVHSYTPGVYNVKHYFIRHNPNGVQVCFDSLTKTITVQSTCTLNAAFTYHTSPANPLTVIFTNTSAGFAAGDSIRWSFGDGTVSYDVNPTHTYANGGPYTVCLRVKRNVPGSTIPACVSENCFQVSVTAPAVCNIQAYYSYQAGTTPSNIIQFTNQTGGYLATDSITWTFGDGSTSNDVNPLHTYATAGTYHACIRVKRIILSSTSPCISEFCRDITITVPCTLQSNYSSHADAANYALIHFTNTTVIPSTATTFTWYFGDGSSATTLNADHTYAQPGTYYACLRSQYGTCVSYHCDSIHVVAPVCTLQSNYSPHADAANYALIHFTNTTVIPSTATMFTWYFGDGSSATTLNADHTYAQPGTYYACLRSQYGTCVSYHCDSIHIVAPVCNVQAYYSYLADATTANLIHFTNQTPGYLPTDSVTWIFGDGTTSHDVNPNHLYANSGTYTACIIIKRMLPGAAPCIRQYCKVITITVPCNIVAGFTWYRDSTAVALYTYHFNNTTVPVSTTDSVRWSFGDGSFSNAYSPNHVYAQAGTYNVCLRVQKRNTNGVLTNCVSEICHTVVVVQICNIQAGYTWHADATNYKKIIFTNTTIAAGTNITATWSFGDGSTSTAWSPTHEYSQAGTYHVCLHIQYGSCSAEHCDTVIVTVPPVPCTQLAAFHMLTTSVTANTFVPDHIYTDVVYTWTFGDGTGSHDVTASHHYQAPGYYTVCLTAYRSNSCAATSCTVINVPASVNCDNITLIFNDHRDTLIPNRITFTAVSNVPITDQVWTITKVLSGATAVPVIIHGNNPTYTFTDSGYYHVCLRTTYANGCVKEICRLFHITNTLTSPTACTLQAYPNPASNTINAILTLTQALQVNAYVYNSANVLVAQKQQQGVVGTNTVSMNIETLTPGVYVLRVVYGNNVCYATFIKQ